MKGAVPRGLKINAQTQNRGWLPKQESCWEGSEVLRDDKLSTSHKCDPNTK